VKSIPTRLIVNSNAALLGAARAAEEIHLGSHMPAGHRPSSRRA
jgi:hypothetical protein